MSGREQTCSPMCWGAPRRVGDCQHPSHSKLACHPHQCPPNQHLESSPWSLSETQLSPHPTEALPTHFLMHLWPRASEPVAQQLCWPHVLSAPSQCSASSTLTHRSRFLPFQQQMTVAGTFHMLWTPEFRRSEALSDFFNEESTVLHSPLAFLVGFLLLKAVAEHEWKSSVRTALPRCYGKRPSSEISSNDQVLVSAEGSRIHHSPEGTLWPNPH